jgi:hypothetical protein
MFLSICSTVFIIVLLKVLHVLTSKEGA